MSEGVDEVMAKHHEIRDDIHHTILKTLWVYMCYSPSYLGFRASRELGLRLTEAGQQIVTEYT